MAKNPLRKTIILKYLKILIFKKIDGNTNLEYLRDYGLYKKISFYRENRSKHNVLFMFYVRPKTAEIY